MTETQTTPEDLDFAANKSFWAGQAAVAREQEEARQRMLALKGQTLVVVKGRKVPVGTTGVCFYSGEGKWGWRVGFKTDAGETVWTDLRNVKAMEALMDSDELVPEPTCSLCDGVGHGYPGAGPCPLEVTDYSGEPDWAL
jgi:hypothetical protein